MSERFEVSIEVLDAAFPASGWKEAYGDVLTRTGLSEGAVEWRWVERSWGVVFEVAFGSESDYERWLVLPAVSAALDAVPDPVAGLVFHRGWGGTSGTGEPRRPRPLLGSGAAEIQLPERRERLLDARAAGISA